ncbi:MAG: calcium/sodium antiporter [Planctomycetota bacterium]
MDTALNLFHSVEGLIERELWVAIVVIIVAFAILAKCADLFVESAVALANRFSIPKLVIGIVLVSFATTAPELAVSLMAAVEGNPEMALGNAIGSVICDDGLALALAGLCSVSAIKVMPNVLKTSGVFLLVIQGVTFGFVYRDFALERWEGAILVGLFLLYLGFMFREHKRGNLKDDLETETEEDYVGMGIGRMLLTFLLGLGGIIFASEFIVTSATSIAHAARVPESVIALTLVAFGTSIPEVATCISAARKGHGEIAVGNIIGADILNICWVAGASSLVNRLALTEKEIWFMFPAMFVIVGVMLILLRMNHVLTRRKGAVLFLLYLVYLAVSILLFPPQGDGAGATSPTPVGATPASLSK